MLNKHQRQAQYMADFADAVTTADPRQAGRIHWPTAQHYFFTGVPAREAAARYLENMKNGPDDLTRA